MIFFVDGWGFMVDGYEEGFYFGLIFFDYVMIDMVIYCEEIFGFVFVIV